MAKGSFNRFLDFKFNNVISWLMKFILVGCLSISLIQNEIIFAAAAAFALLLSLTPQILHLNFKITLPWEIDFLVAFMLVMHILFGEMLDFHGSVFMFDKTMHFFGTATIAILGFMWVYAIHYLTPVNLTMPLMGFFVVMFSMAVGAFWEIAEFLVDIIFGLTTQNGLRDTMLDLIYDFFGGLAVSVFSVLYIKYLEPRRRIQLHKSIREAFHIKSDY